MRTGNRTNNRYLREPPIEQMQDFSGPAIERFVLRGAPYSSFNLWKWTMLLTNCLFGGLSSHHPNSTELVLLSATPLSTLLLCGVLFRHRSHLFPSFASHTRYFGIAMTGRHQNSVPLKPLFESWGMKSRLAAKSNLTSPFYRPPTGRQIHNWPKAEEYKIHFYLCSSFRANNGHQKHSLKRE